MKVAWNEQINRNLVIFEMVLQGKTLKEVAAYAGMSGANVTRIVNKVRYNIRRDLRGTVDFPPDDYGSLYSMRENAGFWIEQARLRQKIIASNSAWFGYVRSIVPVLQEVLNPGGWIRCLKVAAPFLPYCLHPVGEKMPNALIWLNRRYKPIGLSPVGDVDYQQYYWLHVGKDSSVISGLLSCCESSAGVFFLYNDANSPFRSKLNAQSYLRKLAAIDGLIPDF